MKKLIILLLVFLLSFPCFANIFSDLGGWYNENPDKISHGLLGASVAGYALKHLADPGMAILDSGLVGIAKECLDKSIGKQWDGWDAFATLGGGVLLVIL